MRLGKESRASIHPRPSSSLQVMPERLEKINHSQKALFLISGLGCPPFLLSEHCRQRQNAKFVIDCTTKVMEEDYLRMMDSTNFTPPLSPCLDVFFFLWGVQCRENAVESGYFDTVRWTTLRTLGSSDHSLVVPLLLQYNRHDLPPRNSSDTV